jgi:ABC-type antimicrobial peptide transport system permease subunit
MNREPSAECDQIRDLDCSGQKRLDPVLAPTHCAPILHHGDPALLELLQLLFALMALPLAAVGLYGVLAFTVARRRAEIGIRMALGAQRSDVQRMVVGQGMGIVAIALALGVGGALATGRLLGSLLFGVSPGDPGTYVAVVGVLLAVALLACWIPARRASGVDPAEVLRAE